MLPLLLLAPAVAPAAPDVDFLKDVRPILESRCFECHGERKQKGRLRLDRREGLFGDGGGGVIVPGDLEASLLFELVSLPADDPDRMPAEGDSLTAEQLATLRAWIEGGAPFEEPPRERRAETESFPLPPLSPEAAAARDAAVTALVERGVLVLPVAQDLEALDLNASLLRQEAGDAEAKLVAGLEPVLVWASFSGTALGDEGLAVLGGCRELRRLNLSRTRVTDAGLAHLAGLSKLTTLNLYGTAVGDAGLARLAGLAGLRKLYLWQTRVTDAGVERLLAALPDLVVSRGAELTPIEVPEPAGPVNATCPVSGRAVDGAVRSLLDGALIAFCCAECKAKFDADPEAYRDAIPELKKAAGPINAECPVSGEGVDAAVTSAVEGKVVAFCCAKCKAAFDADPAPYLEKLGLKGR